jgi:hypothetical protein
MSATSHVDERVVRSGMRVAPVLDRFVSAELPVRAATRRQSKNSGR